MSENTISDLRSELFATLRALREGKVDVATAKAVSEVAQVVINSAKVEVDFMRETGAQVASGFIPSADPRERVGTKPLPQKPALVGSLK